MSLWTALGLYFVLCLQDAAFPRRKIRTYSFLLFDSRHNRYVYHAHETWICFCRCSKAMTPARIDWLSRHTQLSEKLPYREGDSARLLLYTSALNWRLLFPTSTASCDYLNNAPTRRHDTPITYLFPRVTWSEYLFYLLCSLKKKTILS
jgi:hypothetical protein